jgi:dUTP pyrophosphatase
MHLNIKLVKPEARAFERNPEDLAAVGYDIFCPEDATIDPLQRRLIKVGVKTEFTEGHVGLIRDRSGMGNKGITVLAGVIDPSYRGEWGVILYNTTPHPFEIKAGSKIAQVLFIKVELPDVVIVDGELSESARGEKGFGSSG